jgi:hypothetical protein
MGLLKKPSSFFLFGAGDGDGDGDGGAKAFLIVGPWWGEVFLVWVCSKNLPPFFCLGLVTVTVTVTVGPKRS